MPKLRFIPVSGTTDVTQNMYIWEWGDEMVVVDCGVGFPEAEMFGVDFVIPDFSYVRENKSKLRGIFVSHGHEDHLGALPFLLNEVSAPIYATKLVAGFIEDKLKEYNIQHPKINILNPDEEVGVKLGGFRIDPFRVSHSVPDGVGFAISTPEGVVFHVADYKFDWTPVDGRPFDLAKAAILAKRGVLALASDCLGATTEGYTQSEKQIENTIESLVSSSVNRVYFTTISSNISRIQQAINVAERVGRKVVFIGRSIEKKAEIAKRLGFLHFDSGLIVPLKQAAKFKPAQTLFIISGSYGQIGSALYRLSLAEHEFLKIDLQDVVIFSSDPAPPGAKTQVDFVVDHLIEQGADVHYYDIQENLHVSGHGSQKDIEMLTALVRPKYFLPIGGTVRHMRAYKQLVEEQGHDPGSVFELRGGETVEFSGGSARRGEKYKFREIMVDGLGVGDVGNVVLRDRQLLAKEGVVIAVIQIDRTSGKLFRDPDLVSRGFVFDKKHQDFLRFVAQKLKVQLGGRAGAGGRVVKEETVDFLERYFYEETGRRPMIMPVVVEV